MLIYLYKKIEEEVHALENKQIEQNTKSGVMKLTGFKLGDVNQNFLDGVTKQVLAGVDLIQKKQQTLNPLSISFFLSLCQDQELQFTHDYNTHPQDRPYFIFTEEFKRLLYPFQIQ